jgi:hypothetical protein
MLPTLAERLREQQAKTRGRRPSRPPWPVPGEPPTALLFLPRAEPARAAVPAVPEATALPVAAAMATHAPEVEAGEPAVTATATTEPPKAELLEAEPSKPVPTPAARERTVLAELVLLLVWAVLVVIDGALALAALLDGAARRQRRAPVIALLPAAAPPFLLAAAAP